MTAAGTRWLQADPGNYVFGRRRDTRFRIQGAGCRVQDAKFRMDPLSCILYPASCILYQVSFFQINLILCCNLNS